MANAPCNIIKYEGGDNSVLVYKSPITDFNTESVLIVDESQQAVLYKDGQAEGPFLSGRHVLPTNNIPKFRSLFSKLFSRRKDGAQDGSTPYTCDVFFVNTVNDISVDWGTPSRILVKDPVYNELVNVGANGSVKVKVSDPMRFVVSVNGRMGGYTLERLAATVRAEIMTVLKTYIADMIVSGGVSLLEISTRLLDLSLSVERKLNERLYDFGVESLHMNIQDISIDAASQARLLERQRKINARTDVVLDTRAQTDADYERTVRMASARAQEREIQGYSYQDEQYWTAQKNLAANPGIMFRPGMMPMGFPPVMGGMYPQYGMGGMPGMGGACPNCGNPVQQGASFCPACGAKLQPPMQQQMQGQPMQGQPQQHVHQYTQAATARNCPKCGYPLMPRSTVCPSCNYDTENDKNEK